MMSILQESIEVRRVVTDRLRDIIDPEIGVNIVDLGLIYSIRVENRHLEVEYSTTTPGCPLRRFIEQQIRVAANNLPGIRVSGNPSSGLRLLLNGMLT
jgi:metal-sulfur cluster biosynthetic enzyme